MSKTHVISLALIIAIQLAVSLEAIGQTTPPMATVLQYRPVILAVNLNGLPVDFGTVFLQDDEGNLFAPAPFLKTVNLRTSDLRMIAEDGIVYCDLRKIQGLSYSWNQARAELAISAMPKAFLPTHINIGTSAPREVSPYTPGAYFNYDLALTRGSGSSASQGLFDFGLFRGEGLLTSSFTAAATHSARLMSTYQTDRIAALKTLRLGDSYNNTGAWGRGILFGGIQYGSNFAIRPDFVTLSMPSVSGTAWLPSTVDVYVNNVLRTSQRVNAGPFSIQNLPVFTGAGEAQIVVKDMLGREQLITQAFFASPELLREGLVEDAYELGWLRQNYGLTSYDYREPFAAATYRKGLSKRLTGEARVELQKNLAVVGGSVAVTLPRISSEIESSTAVSSMRGLTPGVMSRVSYSYLGQRWSANALMQLNSLSFRQLGSNLASLPQQIVNAQVSAPLGDGTLSMNYLRRLNQGESVTRIINLNYSQPLAKDVFVTCMLIKPMSAGAGTTAGITLTMIIDQNHSANATLNAGTGAATLYAEYQQATPREDGIGYRFAALNGGNSVHQEVEVARNQSFGRFQAELVRSGGAVSSRLTADGGIESLGDGVYFSHGHDAGFAIVQIKDSPQVPVYLENQVVAHTDQRGRAVVGNLLPYQRNRISIDPLTLPLESSVSEIEKIVVLRSQGGVFVDFNVRKVRSATLLIVRADGKPLPAWTPVEVLGMERSFVSGNRGEVSVELQNMKGNRVIARPSGEPACELSVDVPDSLSIMPFLGPLTCATIH